ncbi:MAG: hypothetical protein ABI603_03525 [Acidobacteriota bacterium]
MKATDFQIESMNGVKVRLSDEVARGPLVLTVLRGWPGYDDKRETVTFASVSRGHGDRVSTEVVLKALAQKP